jgi:hypothetical protein
MSKNEDADRGGELRDRDEELREEFQRGMAGWGSAVRAHAQAPPDHNFAARLADLAQGCSEAARVCRLAGAAGLEWSPHRKANSEPPYELRPGTGRRGPAELWQQFDEAVTRLGVHVAGTDIIKVADAYEDLAAAAGQLADAVAAEDQAGARPRARAGARRSA